MICLEKNMCVFVKEDLYASFFSFSSIVLSLSYLVLN